MTLNDKNDLIIKNWVRYLLKSRSRVRALKRETLDELTISTGSAFQGLTILTKRNFYIDYVEFTALIAYNCVLSCLDHTALGGATMVPFDRAPPMLMLWFLDKKKSVSQYVMLPLDAIIGYFV